MLCFLNFAIIHEINNSLVFENLWTRNIRKYCRLVSIEPLICSNETAYYCLHRRPRWALFTIYTNNLYTFSIHPNRDEKSVFGIKAKSEYNVERGSVKSCLKRQGKEQEVHIYCDYCLGWSIKPHILKTSQNTKTQYLYRSFINQHTNRTQ